MLLNVLHKPPPKLTRRGCFGTLSAVMENTVQNPLPPVQPQVQNSPVPATEVYMTLAYQYYDAIARGEKLVEYRQFKPKWVNSLLSGNLKTVKFQRGYTPQQMRWEVSFVGVVDIFGKEIRAFMPDGTMNPEGMSDSFYPQFIAVHLGKRVG